MPTTSTSSSPTRPSGCRCGRRTSAACTRRCGASFLQPAWDHVWVPYLRAPLSASTSTTAPRACCRCGAPVPQVVTVHDLAVYHQPETFAWLQRVHQRSHTPFAVRHAARVIADSAHGRQDLLEHFQLPPASRGGHPAGRQPDVHRAGGAGRCAHCGRARRCRSRYVLYAGHHPAAEERRAVDRGVRRSGRPWRRSTADRRTRASRAIVPPVSDEPAAAACAISGR